MLFMFLYKYILFIYIYTSEVKTPFSLIWIDDIDFLLDDEDFGVVVVVLLLVGKCTGHTIYLSFILWILTGKHFEWNAFVHLTHCNK